MDYVLSLDMCGFIYYWQGGGVFTINPYEAKKYPSWKMAAYWCRRITRYDLKYCTIDELQELGYATDDMPI